MTVFCPKCNEPNTINEQSHGFKSRSLAAFKRSVGADGKPMLVITCNYCGCDFNPAKPDEIAFDPTYTAKAKRRRQSANIVKVFMYIFAALFALGSFAAFADKSIGSGIFMFLLMFFALLLVRATKVPPKIW